MKINLKLARVGMNMAEATIAKWHKQPGESFKAGDVLYDIESDKVTQEVTGDERWEAARRSSCPPGRLPRWARRVSTRVELSSLIAARRSEGCHPALLIRRPSIRGLSPRRLQPIPHPRLRHQIPRLPRIRLQLLPQIPNRHAQTARIAQPIRPPDLLNQLILRNDQPRTAREALEHPILQRREMHRPRRPLGFTPREIELNLPQRTTGSPSVPRHVAPERRAHTRQQLRRAERLGHVVVSARIERGDLLLFHGASGEHDDRHGRPLAHASNQREAIPIGQPQVDEHQVGLVSPRFDLAAPAVLRFDDPIARRLEQHAHDVADLRLVFDRSST